MRLQNPSLLLTFAALVAICPVFGAGKPQPQPETTVSFVEEPNIPEGKAVIYFYNGIGIQEKTWILTKDGPIAVSGAGYYYSCFIDPGSMQLWPVVFQTNPSVFNTLPVPRLTPITLSIEAGQSYYVKIGDNPKWLALIPAEKAKTLGEILRSKKVE